MSNLSEISVAILAGGPGTRIAQTVKGKPKVLAEIRKHPFLEYLLHQLNQADFKNIVLCTGYLSDQVEKAFGKKYKNLQLLYSPEQMPLGTAGALRNAFPLLHSQTILVMNGDSFCNVDFKKLWQFHLSKKSKATIILSRVSDVSRFGTITLGNDNNIIKFQEKKAARLSAPERSDGGQENEAGLVNAGIYLISKAFIAEIPQNKVLSIETDILRNWIGKGFYGYDSNNNFIDIGTPEDYVRAEHFFDQYKL